MVTNDPRRRRLGLELRGNVLVFQQSLENVSISNNDEIHQNALFYCIQ
jgi:hypothetical protein